MSSLKTKFLNLHKWIGIDFVKRDEVVENFDKIDAELEGHASSLAENVQQISEHRTQISNLEIDKASKNDVNTLATEKANQIDLVTERARIDNLVQTSSSSFYEKCLSTDTGALLVVDTGATTGQINLASVTPVATGYAPIAGDYVRLVYGVASGSSELIDGRTDKDGVVWDSVGNAIREAINGLTEFIQPVHLEILSNKFMANGDYNNLTDNTGYDVAIVDVEVGKCYELKTKTFGGSNYAYSFYYYDGNTYTNKGNFLLGTAGTNIERDVNFKIPTGVNKVIFSYQKGYQYTVAMFEREQKITKNANAIENIKSDLYEYTPVEFSGEEYKIFNYGIAPLVDIAGRYYSTEIPVSEGEYYHLLSGTFGDVNFGYSLYNKTNDIYKLYGRYLRGTASTYTPVDTYIKIPKNVNTLCISFPLDHVHAILLKRTVPTKEILAKQNINDYIYAGMSANGGKLPLVDTISGYSMKDNCAAIIPVDAGEIYELKGRTFGGVYFYTFYNGSTFVDYGKLGTPSTEVIWDETIQIPNGVNTLVVNSTKMYGIELYKYEKIADIVSKCSFKKLNGKKYACFGDSITSDEVTGTGTVVGNLLGANIVGNFAHGNATGSDWFNGTTNDTVIKFDTATNADTNDNVLSNQVRRLLRHTTASGQQIAWTHPIDGSFSIDTAIGTGLGNTDDKPDIIYIAIGTNDGRSESGYAISPTTVIDDTDTVFLQTYSQLTRKGLASALRWAIETLQSAYPNANIFVASPLQANNVSTHLAYSALKQKRDIIEKVCQYCSVKFIDSFSESGFSKMIAYPNYGADSIGVHPNQLWKINNAKFIANEINNRYISRGLWFYKI